MLALRDHEIKEVYSITAQASNERERLRRTLDFIIERIGVREIIMRILDDEAALRKIASRSFPHSNGFDRIAIVDLPDVLRIRLHVWWSGDTLISERVHNHGWNFCSTILAGLLNARFYDASAAVDGAYRLWRLGPPPPGARFGYTYSPDARVDLVERLEVTLKTGASYYLDNQMLHRVTANLESTQGCATIIAHGALVRNASEIVVPLHESIPPSRAPELYKPDTLAAALIRALGVIQGSLSEL